MAVGNPFRLALDLKLNRAALARTLESRHRNDLRIELGSMAQTIAGRSTGAWACGPVSLFRIAISRPIAARIRLFPKKCVAALSAKVAFIRLRKRAALECHIQRLLR
jgi:hypothetical protein